MADETETNTLNLENLISMVGNNPPELKELLQSFLDNATELLAQMENATLFEDLELWKRSTHRLRGAAANFGFEALQHICGRAEESSTMESMEGDLAQIRTSLTEARHATAETIARL